MSVYSTPNAERVRKLHAELRYEIGKARIERRYAYVWGFVAGFVCALSISVIASL